MELIRSIGRGSWPLFLKRMFWESLFFKMDKVVLFDNIHI